MDFPRVLCSAGPRLHYCNEGLCSNFLHLMFTDNFVVPTVNASTIRFVGLSVAFCTFCAVNYFVNRIKQAALHAALANPKVNEHFLHIIPLQ